MAVDDNAAMLLKRFGSLENQRQTWESHWQEIADYVVPRKADVTKVRSPGDKRSELIFDGTAIHAAELLSASLHGMLTNASTSWFSLSFGDRELDGDDEAREWLQSVEDVMYNSFNRSNFQEQIHELYHDLITFGTAVMFVESDEDFSLRFRPGISQSAICQKTRTAASIPSIASSRCRPGPSWPGSGLKTSARRC